MAPPRSADPAPVRAIAKRLIGKVHALGVSDNRDRVSMSALVAASLVAAEGSRADLAHGYAGPEPRGHDRRLPGCSGTGRSQYPLHDGNAPDPGAIPRRQERFDLDCIQLLRLVAGLDGDASLVGEDRIENAGPFCLGGVAARRTLIRWNSRSCGYPRRPRGVQFLITQPIYDVQRFEAWWNELQRQGIHQKVAVVAGIEPLHRAEEAKRANEKRPSARIPGAW